MSIHELEIYLGVARFHELETMFAKIRATMKKAPLALVKPKIEKTVLGYNWDDHTINLIKYKLSSEAEQIYGGYVNIYYWKI